MTHKPTIRQLLSNALKPMGHTLYIYGGGWNTEDTGAAAETRTIGISPCWRQFFERQNVLYSYRNNDDPQNSFYPHNGINTYHEWGLDCSGYIGWIVYNTLCTENGKEGFVTSSTRFAHSLAEKGLGLYTKEKYLCPGDIVSMKGHVWLCIGVCHDESVLIAHSTPSPSRSGKQGGGVQLTALSHAPNQNCEAYRLADQYMKTRFPSWYERYPVLCRSLASYTDFDAPETGKFSWTLSENTLCDPEGIRHMNAEDVLKRLI